MQCPLILLSFVRHSLGKQCGKKQPGLLPHGSKLAQARTACTGGTFCFVWEKQSAWIQAALSHWDVVNCLSLSLLFMRESKWSCGVKPQTNLLLSGNVWPDSVGLQVSGKAFTGSSCVL